MAVAITMPRLSDSMEEGTVVKWVVEVGAHVERGQALVEIDTDKATMEYEAETSGTLLSVLVPEGADAPIGAVIAWLGEPGETPPDGQPDAAPASGPGDCSPFGARAVRVRAAPLGWSRQRVSCREAACPRPRHRRRDRDRVGARRDDLARGRRGGGSRGLGCADRAYGRLHSGAR